MEKLPHGLTLALPEGSFPLSTDSMVLAHLTRLPKNAAVLDLGSGCGTLGLLLASRDMHCTVTGIELTQAAHDAAEENIRRCGLAMRLSSICADLRSISGIVPRAAFSVCVSNPPYFSGGPASLRTPLARRNDCCTARDLFRAANYALRFGGDFYLVQKPENLAHLIACGAEAGLEAKHLYLVRHRTGGPVSLIVLAFRKGAKPGLIMDELCLHDETGNPTAHYRAIYHI